MVLFPPNGFPPVGITLYFPVQLEGGFPSSGLVDKPWSQVSPVLPPGNRIHFSRDFRVQHFIPTDRRFFIEVLPARAL